MSNQGKEDKNDEAPKKESHDADDNSSDDQNNDDDKERGEGSGNLRRRSDWFQKRHGGG